MMLSAIVALVIVLSSCLWPSKINDMLTEEATKENRLAGVWGGNYFADIEQTLLVFNNDNELCCINFDLSNYLEFGRGEIYKDEVIFYTYEEIDENTIRLYSDGNSSDLDYDLNQESLIIDDMTYHKIDRQTNSPKSVVGTWKFYNNIEWWFELINHTADLYEFAFYGDNTFSFTDTDGDEYNGEYRVIHDGKSLEMYYDGYKDTYSFHLLGNGLMLLSSGGNDTGYGFTDYYCLLESVE